MINIKTTPVDSCIKIVKIMLLPLIITIICFLQVFGGLLRLCI